MTIQESFLTNIEEMQRGYYKFIVSRNFSSPKDAILQQYVPAGFPTEFVVEISMFTADGNTLVYNAMHKSTTDGAFSIKTLQYDNYEIRRLLFIDFGSILDNFPVGEFTVVFNFYTIEFGDIGVPLLEVSQISPSGRELELTVPFSSRTTGSNQKLEDFVRPRIPASSVMNVLEQVFDTGSIVELPTDNTRLSLTSLISSSIPAGLTAETRQYVADNADWILRNSYVVVKKRVETKISSGSTSFTDRELNNLITRTISEMYALKMSEIQQSPIPQRVQFTILED